jgi:transcriptional regulator with XRE-family HTH domain
MAFADNLKREREATGHTQASLAEASGVPVTTIRDYEQRKRQPTLANAHKLAQALGVSLDVLAALAEDVSSKAPKRKGKK